MAFGRHWEWRGFGHVDPAQRRCIQRLPSLLPSAQSLTDLYLWAPGCPVNVKLRSGDLKFKRLVRATGGLECWLEDEQDIHPFPLEPPTVEALRQALNITLSSLPGRPLRRADLLRLLATANPPVRFISVQKSRCFYSLQGLQPDEQVDLPQVELTDITSPQMVTTVALEHPRPGPVHRARALLGLDSSELSVLSYLEVIAIWADGERVAL